MSEAKVSALYDQLLATELKIRGQAQYPIHKVLTFSDKGITDIYAWIANKFGLPQSGEILDAGCGMGWGSTFLAQHTSANILGISVSAAEVAQATKITQAHQQEDAGGYHNLCFSKMSFDEAQANTYSLIVAVESVKHSPDIRATLSTLIAALAPDGKLIIVDDVYSGDQHNSIISQFKSDWQLIEVLNTEHFSPCDADKPSMQEENRNQFFAYDLTSLMSIKPSFLSYLKRYFFSFLLLFRPNHMPWQAFRGGFILDALYSDNSMSYKVLVFHKEG